jgi:MtN3 and saliva related transmembrane protein
MFLDIAGLVASVTSVVGFIPQILKIKHNKSTKDVSLLMVLNFFVCSIAWVIYGYYTHAFYVVLTNVISSFFCTILMCQVFYYRRG